MSEEENIVDDMEYETLNSIIEQFNTINDTLTLFKMQINSLQQKVKSVEKSVKKELKNLKKDKKKSKPKNKKAPSGFAKPTKVTKELCEFMDRPEGSEIARTEVTKMLVSYIKTNNLIESNTDYNNKNNKNNKIVPDEKLKNLLGIQEHELNNLNYFNIQKYMNKHFYSNKSSQNLNI
jgi:FtsZ-binding cell division protein ZapB